MSSRTRLLLIGIGAVLYTGVIFWLGTGIGARTNLHRTAIEIDNTQAMLTFNRLLEGRRLELLLSKGCLDAAREKVDIRMDQDTKLLASLFKGTLSPWVAKYVDDRDPRFLGTLDKFRSKYGDSWVEPDCEQNRSPKKRAAD
jgi:hypothetical protein